MATINMLPPNPTSFYERGVRAIAKIERTEGDGSPGTTDIYTIYYTDATTSTFPVTHGADGEDGEDGEGGSVTTVQTITGTSPTLSLEGGAIKTWTLTGTSTFTLDLADGESLRLHIIPNGNALTLPTVRWPIAGEPTVPTWDEIVLKFVAVGEYVYGDHVGSYVIPEPIPEPGDPWTPLQVSPILWLDANRPQSLTVTSGLVDEWRDRTDNDFHASQTGSARPEYVADGINSLPSVEFGPGLTLVGMHGVQNWQEVFVVAQWTGGGTAFPEYNGLFTGTTGAEGDVVLIGTPGVGLYATPGTFSINATADAAAFPAITDPTLLHRFFPSPASVNNYQIGNDRNNAGRNWQGLIGEVIAFDETPTTDTRQRVEGYAAHKWGFADKLPIDHPYYAAAPTIEAPAP